MRQWAKLLAGLIVWAVHFFALYAIGSVFLTTTLARVLVLIVSAGCLAADGLLFARMLRAADPDDGFGEWARTTTLLGLGISAVAVAWQALPALLI